MLTLTTLRTVRQTHFCLVRRQLSSTYDVAIVGGGIIGCATARELAIKKPELKIVLLEKEQSLGEFSLSSSCC